MSEAEMLTDEQWTIPEPLFQEERTGVGHPSSYYHEVPNGIFWGCAICPTDFHIA